MYRSPVTGSQNASGLEFELSRPIKVKCNGAIGLSTYDFLLVFNSNEWHNWAYEI